MSKVVVITGGEGLLGRTFIEASTNVGHLCVSADISVINESIEQVSEKTYTIKLDITSAESVQHVITEIEKKIGKIDCWVNNAYPRNKRYGTKPEEVTYSDFCENINMHLGGYFLCMQKLCSYFEKKSVGNIINMASIYGVVPPRFDIYSGTNMTMPPEYNVIKTSVVSLSKYFAKYYRGSNIRINCISPGGILDSQPASFLSKYKEQCLNKGMLSPNDVCGTLLFLISDDSLYINGQNIIVDDGFVL